MHALSKAFSQMNEWFPLYIVSLYEFAYIQGNVAVKVVPADSLLVTVMAPPC